MIVKVERRKTAHGTRCVVICVDHNEDDEENNLFIIFLSPSYNEAKKYNALEALVKDKRSTTYITLQSVKEESDMKIPIYSFSCKCR